MPSEPDYEQIMQDREEARDERWLARMDRIYGTVEQYRRPANSCPDKVDNGPARA
jgi:hypothetical protein